MPPSQKNKLHRFSLLILSLSFFLIALSACDEENQAKFQGYIEGRFSYIAPNYSGILKKLFVARGTEVNEGQPLFILEPQPESHVLNQAKAQMDQAQAQKKQMESAYALAKVTLQRDESLLPKKFIAEQVVDEARTQFKQAKEQLSQAEANLQASRAKLAQAQWSWEQKAVAAPKSALVFDTYFLPGELVNAGQPVLSLLAPQDIKVIFFVGEAYLGRLKLGDVVKINCDSCPQGIRAKISFISPQAEYTPPVIYSNETSKKLVYRIEAMPVVDEALRLHPGQPVTVEN